MSGIVAAGAAVGAVGSTRTTSQSLGMPPVQAFAGIVTLELPSAAVSVVELASDVFFSVYGAVAVGVG